MERTNIDFLWIIVSCTLVFVMRAGFALLESGLARSKNSINVAIKNLTDFGISFLCFWLAGFGIMFGISKSGFFGTTDFFLHINNNFWLGSFFLYQSMFASTTATIVCGAVAERIKYSSYIILTIIGSLLIYPVFGHWVWGGLFEGHVSGWLGKLGFIDFAGSSVVHSIGGWMSLAGVLILGPRIGRFEKKDITSTSSNVPSAVIGAFLLWFGWFGFNGGSTLRFNNEVGTIILNTTLAGSSGLIVTLAIGWFIYKYPKVDLVINGSLAGLVAITASCAYVNEFQAIIIGSIGGIVMLTVDFLLVKFRIDDVVGAIPVHLGAGIWGTFTVGIFGNLTKLNTGLDRAGQILIQLTGIVSGFLWGFIISYLLLFLVNKFFPLRTDAKSETDGLNVAEHGAKTEIFDLVSIRIVYLSSSNTKKLRITEKSGY